MSGRQYESSLSRRGRCALGVLQSYRGSYLLGGEFMMNKTEWLDSVRHIHAQDAAWFVIFVFVVIGIAMWLDMRKDRKDK